jgi:uncharacterized membrane protein YdjX (TVP38/TMEM64 family)
MPSSAIEVKGLVKKHGDRVAVNGVNLSILEGEIFRWKIFSLAWDPSASEGLGNTKKRGALLMTKVILCCYIDNWMNLMMRVWPQSKMKRAGVICFLVLLALLVYQYYSEIWTQTVKLWNLLPDHHRLRDFILSFGVYSPLVFILLQVMQVVVAPIPGGATEFLGGYLFGVKAGFFYSMIGLTLGSWVAFKIARMFEKWAIEKFVSVQTMRRFDYLVEHEGVIISFLLFLIPGFPKDALCYILGLTPMHLGMFLVISTIGRVPGTLIATLQGAKAFEEQYKLFLILLGVSALLILVFYIYHEKIHQFIQQWWRHK